MPCAFSLLSAIAILFRESPIVTPNTVHSSILIYCHHHRPTDLLPADTRVQFMRNIAGKSTKEKHAMAKETITGSELSSESYAMAGAFLSLGVCCTLWGCFGLRGGRG